jgi:hypothetical protein
MVWLSSARGQWGGFIFKAVQIFIFLIEKWEKNIFGKVEKMF